MTPQALARLLAVILFVVAGFYFSEPVNAGTDWACRQGNSTVDEYIARVEKIGPRFWTQMTGGEQFQNLYLLNENGIAWVHIFTDQCIFASKKLSKHQIVDLFDLDLRIVFPIIEKPVSKKGSH